MSTWSESGDDTQAAAYTACLYRRVRRPAAFRSLYAEEWTDVAAILRAADGPEPALDEAASVIQSIAREERSSNTSAERSENELASPTSNFGFSRGHVSV